MSSFKRKASQTTQKPPDGTKSSPAQPSILLTSTGVPSLDDILGGGIQLGTDVVILNADPHSAHSDLLQKYYIAQGIASNHEVHVLSPDGRHLVESCMWTNSTPINEAPATEEDPESTNVEEKVKIAWRYERMQKFKTTVSSTSQYVSRPFVFRTRPTLRMQRRLLSTFRSDMSTPHFSRGCISDLRRSPFERRHF